VRVHVHARACACMRASLSPHLCVLGSFSRKAAKAHKDLIHIDTIDKQLRTGDARNKPEGVNLNLNLNVCFIRECKSVFLCDANLNVCFTFTPFCECEYVACQE